MKLELQDGVLSVSGLKELDGGNSLCREVRAQMPERLRAIEIDFSQMEFLNSSGLGELVALHKMALQQSGDVMVRVLNPPMPVQQLFELTRLNRVFEILKR